MILLLLLAFPHEDCVQMAAKALRVDPPALAMDDSLPYRALYQYGTIVLRSDADCGVIVHEMVHHRQFRDAGSAKTDQEWFEREREAHHIEVRYRGN